MKTLLGITGRDIQMTNKIAVIVVLGFALIAFNHVAWIGRVEQLREWNGGADGVFRTSR